MSREIPFERIKKLRCHREVYERLCAGYPCPEVARYIQEDEGECLDMVRRSLSEILRQYAEREIVGVDLIAPRLPHLVVKAQKEFGDRMEDLRRLERAYEALLYRFDLSHGEERRNGKVNPDVDRQAKVLMDYISRMHDIKMDLGLTGSRDLGTLTVSAERLAEIRDKYGEGAARAFGDPVSRAKVLGLLRRVIRISDRGDVMESDMEEANLGSRDDSEQYPDAIDAEYSESITPKSALGPTEEDSGKR
jgi:hypothetical protein